MKLKRRDFINSAAMVGAGVALSPFAIPIRKGWIFADSISQKPARKRQRNLARMITIIAICWN
jgi:hypothetical protein